MRIEAANAGKFTKMIEELNAASLALYSAALTAEELGSEGRSLELAEELLQKAIKLSFRVESYKDMRDSLEHGVDAVQF